MNMNKQSPSSTRQQPNVVGLFAKNNYYEVSLKTALLVVLTMHQKEMILKVGM